MKDRINLDDPSYNQNQNRVATQDNKAKTLWVVLGVLAAILVVVAIMQSGNSSSGSSGSIVKHGMYFDYYDDNGDGWVDRMYSYDLNRWSNVPTGNLSMDQAA